MCLKACQRKLQEQAAFVFIEGRGPKTDKKPLAFVGSMSAVTSIVKFSSLQLLPSCVGEKQAFSATNGGR